MSPRRPKPRLTRQERSAINRANRAKGHIDPYRRHPLRDIHKRLLFLYAPDRIYPSWLSLGTFCDEATQQAGPRPSSFHWLVSGSTDWEFGPPVSWQVRTPEQYLTRTAGNYARKVIDRWEQQQCVCPYEIARYCPCSWGRLIFADWLGEIDLHRPPEPWEREDAT